MRNEQQARRLKAARLTAGYATSKAFCEKFNVPNSTYSQHESGKYALKDSVAKEYAEYLGVNMEWLKDGQGDPVDAKHYKRADSITNALHEDTIVNEIFEKRYAVLPLDEKLIAALITALHRYSNNRPRPLSYEQIAEATAGLYVHLSKADIEPQLVDKMIKIAIEAYFHSTNKETD